MDLEEVLRFVLAFGHVDGHELELDIFLEQAGENSRHCCRQRRAVHCNASHFSLWRSDSLVLCLA